jgi:Protein of unknown function (DUF3012)
MSARMSRCANVLWLAACLLAAAGCAPEVGSERWCEAMRDKPRGDWSANEALDYAQHCILDDDDEE